MLIEQATSSGSELKSPSQRDDPPSEEINNIMMRKQIGVSKDSGIHSMSRPVTASDYRESPEVRETTFEPILKDMNKHSLGVIANVLPTSQTSTLSSLKKKPPPSIIRFSPQMEEKLQQPHELSTIVEVETPVASKVNILEEEKIDLTRESINYEDFPDYEEYLKKVENQTAGDLQKLFEVSQLKYQKFVAPAEYGIEEISGLQKEDDKNDGNSSDSSIHDIVAELKRRKIIDKSFENLCGSGDDEDDGPDEKDHLAEIVKSPKKMIQNSSGNVIEKESSRILPSPPPSPVKVNAPEKSTQKLEKLRSSQKLDKSPRKSESPRLEDDFSEMGMRWMTSMLKRNQESNTLHSSSSSTSVSLNNHEKPEKNEKNPCRPERRLLSRTTYELEMRAVDSSSRTTNSSSETPPSGKPLNLKDFLRRELLMRSESKNLSNESSLSSRFLQSLLNANESTSSNSGGVSQDLKLRTSTPVQLDSTKFGASLFSADSRMSSVRMSSSGEDKKSPT